MFFIQVALTCAIVHWMSFGLLKTAFAKMLATNGPPPRATLFVYTASYWVGIVSALAGIWSFSG